MYGSAIGASKYDVVTPALVVDRNILRANLDYMQSRLPEAPDPSRSRAKTSKSRTSPACTERWAHWVVVDAARMFGAIVMLGRGQMTFSSRTSS